MSHAEHADRPTGTLPAAAGKMSRLSDVLRAAGSLNQAFGNYAEFEGAGDRQTELYCAAGAVAHLAFDMDADAIVDGPVDPQPSIKKRLEQTWPAAEEMRCPLRHVCSSWTATYTLHDLLVHLNDAHELAFGEIADHVRRLEDSGIIADSAVPQAACRA